jgi:hypothetical protein
MIDGLPSDNARDNLLTVPTSAGLCYTSVPEIFPPPRAIGIRFAVNATKPPVRC